MALQVVLCRRLYYYSLVTNEVRYQIEEITVAVFIILILVFTSMFTSIIVTIKKQTWSIHQSIQTNIVQNLIQCPVFFSSSYGLMDLTNPTAE